MQGGTTMTKKRDALILAALLVGSATVVAVAPPGPAGPGDATPSPPLPSARLWEGAGAAGLSPPADAPALADLEAGTLRAGVLELYALVGAVPTERGLARLDAGLAEVPPDVQAPAALVLAAMNEAARMRHAAFAGVPVDDLAFAYRAGLRSDLSAAEEVRLSSVVARVDRAGMAAAAALVLDAVATARPLLADAAASHGAALSDLNWTDPLGAVQISGAADHVHTEDRTLQIDLGGDDDWKNNAGATFPEFLIKAVPGCITTGGLDCMPLHPKRQGTAVRSLLGRECSVNLVAPVFHGQAYAQAVEDEVEAQLDGPDPDGAAAFATEETPAAAGQAAASTDPDTRCLPQGPDDVEPWAGDFVTKGILSDGDEHLVAVALDVAGNDRFAPPKSFNKMVDGTNPAGCDSRDMGEEGKLWDRNLTAGSGFAGVGVLWDGEGSDFYGGRSLTQGSGHVAGVGVLVDRGRGNDHYVAVRVAQALGLAGGFGMIHDDGGDDRYELRNDIPFFNEFEHFIGCDVSTRDGQGRANFVGVGVLLDEAGDDVYFVQQHDEDIPGAARDDPTTTQGSTGVRLNVGPHPVNELMAAGRGLLWDRGGQDSYTRPGRGNGCMSLGGTFLDEGGSLTGSLGPC